MEISKIGVPEWACWSFADIDVHHVASSFVNLL